MRTGFFLEQGLRGAAGTGDASHTTETSHRSEEGSMPQNHGEESKAEQ